MKEGWVDGLARNAQYMFETGIVNVSLNFGELSEILCVGGARLGRFGGKEDI